MRLGGSICKSQAITGRFKPRLRHGGLSAPTAAATTPPCKVPRSIQYRQREARGTFGLHNACYRTLKVTDSNGTSLTD